MSNKCVSKRRVSEAAPGGHQYNKGKKEKVVNISDTSRYYFPDEWNNLSSAKKSKLLSNTRGVAAK